MISLHRSVLFSAMIPFFLMATPSQAQTSATLHVTARVVQQCVISAEDQKRIDRVFQQTGRVIDVSQRCSGGVVSLVTERPVSRRIFRPTVPLPRQISREQLARRTASGRSDVYLVTVSY